MELRRRQAAQSLLTHSIFGFQVHDIVISHRLRDLQELLMATCAERDQITLLGKKIHEIENQLKTHKDEGFLLEPLRRFEQEMELLLDVDSGDDEGTMEEEEEDPLLLTDDEECLSCSPAPLISTTLTPLNRYTITKPKKRQDVVCRVCYAQDSHKNDLIVICKVCGVAVHQTCYRLGEVHKEDWYCLPCRQYLDAQNNEKELIPTHELECAACCIKAGAMVPTVDGEWVHVACSMFLPELYLQDKSASRLQGLPEDLQIVCGLDKLKQKRRLRCCFCKKSNEKGAYAQCTVDKCVVAYHALCALRNGIKLRYIEDQGQFGSTCFKHQAKLLKVDRDDEANVNLGGEIGVTLLEEADKYKTKRLRKGFASEGNVSASDDTNDGDNKLGSDNDNRKNSLSDVNHCLYGEKQETSTQPTPTKVSPPRLPGGPPLCKSGEIYSSSPSPFPKDAATHGRLVYHTQKYVSSNSRVVLQTNVFAPVLYPPTYIREEPSERDFEYVMVLIPSRPLGLGIVSSVEGIFLLAQNTRNPAIVAALECRVIQDGDEIFALNDLTLRNTRLKRFENDVVPALLLPVRCWFRTRRKKSKFTPAFPKVAPVCVAAPVNNVIGTSAFVKQQAMASCSIAATSSSDSFRSESHSSDLAHSSDALREEIMSGGIDWPWVFLRSDGKLAMKLFWKTLDSAFFMRKINKRLFLQLQRKVEAMCGVCLNPSHLEYDQVRELLIMPRCERVPAYLVDFRKMRKQKHKFLMSTILTGASGDANTTVDEESALEVGTTVSVTKRTWPGMNKLGGIGRIKQVNEKVLRNGKKRFTYNVAYVLSGNEKNVERKYISVVDLDAVEPDKTGKDSSTLIGMSQKCESETGVKDTEEIDTSTLSMRLCVAVSRIADTATLTKLQDAGIERPPKRRRFHLQFSTSDSTVYCERKTGHLDHAVSAKELLMHRNCEVKLSHVRALTNACFTSELLSIEDRNGDENDTDNEGEGDAIKSELATLQQQLCSVVESNELAFACLTTKVKKEYASKEYHKHELQKIKWRNFERMYQELQAARRQFDESDEGSDVDEDERVLGAGTKAGSDEGEKSEKEDISFGGMFVNNLKQEGSEVCALCELSGGDFTATDTGRVVHPRCAMFTPETFFKDGVVHGIDLVDPQRQQLKCSLCGGRKGLSKIQCAHRKCVRAYHVACAFVNGLLTIDQHYQAWCPRHLKISGMEQFVELPDHLAKNLPTLQ